jgi:hypothetical protein
MMTLKATVYRALLLSAATRVKQHLLELQVYQERFSAEFVSEMSPGRETSVFSGQHCARSPHTGYPGVFPENNDGNRYQQGLGRGHLDPDLNVPGREQWRFLTCIKGLWKTCSIQPVLFGPELIPGEWVCQRKNQIKTDKQLCLHGT